MKWVFLAACIVAVPLFSNWLRQNPQHALKVWIGIGFLPFAQTIRPEFDIAVISWAFWPGYVKGLEISLLDAAALAIYLSRRRRGPVAFRTAMMVYLATIAASVVVAQVPMAATFYLWQFARVLFLFVVVARACAEDNRVPLAILSGLIIGISYEAVLVVWQRFGLGIVQTAGTFGHQNGLAMAAHFVLYPCFALLLASQRNRLYWLGIVAAAVAAILTVSRAGVGFAAIGLALTFLLSAGRGWSAHKGRIALAGVLVVAIAVPVVLAQFERRFTETGNVGEVGGYDERAAFERAAMMIFSDHPLGVGANNYVVVANSGGYMARAGVTWFGGSRSTSVHNAYWLAAAETGVLGVLALVFMLARITATALLRQRRIKHDQRGDLLLGFGVTIVIVACHSYFEWIFFVSFIQYFFALATGAIAGLTAAKSVANQSQVYAPRPVARARIGAD